MPGSDAPIVLDAMGGDHAPRDQVAGAVAAERFDADAHGGAALLGLGGTVVIAHGSARARAITRACLLAHDLVGAGITGPGGQPVAGSAVGVPS